MRKIILYSVIILFTCLTSKAQFVEDAVRMANSNEPISSRAAGLGISYAGIADDYSALYYNPAGLSLLAKKEFSIGLEFLRTSTTSDFMGNSSSIGSSFVSLSHVGIAFPFKTHIGIGAVAVGYNFEHSFDNTLQFDGFNPTSSIVQSLTGETTDLEQNLAYQASLADKATNGTLHSPIIGNLQQTGFITERGGIHNFSVGGSLSLSQSFAVGLTIARKWGTYHYARKYDESDKNDVYTVWDSVNFTTSDFSSLTLNENLDQEFSGVSGTIGLQGRFSDAFRFGVTIKTPTYYHISEVSSSSITARFDNGFTGIPKYPGNGNSYDYQNSYDIITPFIFGFGFSYHSGGLTVSTSAEYNDMSQLQFNNALSEIMSINNDILRTLTGSVTYGLGAEFELPNSPVIIRASYTGISSPYANTAIKGSNQYFGVGCGIYVAPNARLDFAGRYSAYSQTRSNYGTSGSFVDYNFSPLQVSAQLTYRY
ncbi:MAG: hypothetical protein HYZ54_11335 [Ignavibacteriae bacterium]|nr:hypothetical protein [Ignavibacteriota bacterium]